MKKIGVIILCVFLCNTVMYGQDVGSEYLKRAETSLNSGDCKEAKKWYLTYKNVTGKTDSNIENRIKKCEEGNDAVSQTKVQIDWVDIPAGTFTMGSPADEPERYSDEGQHQVSLSGFDMSKYAITFAQYDAFCEATGRAKPLDSGWGRGSRPVINVSWHDAVAFCNWVGGGCRLPTEAEWEYACRAGTTTPFYTGNNLSTVQGNYNGSYPYNNNPNGEHRQKTLAVGSSSSNAWGLYDMHGNVDEWCSDWHGAYSGASQIDPKGPSSGDRKVLRGGNWGSRARFCRSAYRNLNSPSYSTNFVGFRVVFSK